MLCVKIEASKGRYSSASRKVAYSLRWPTRLGSTLAKSNMLLVALALAAIVEITAVYHHLIVRGRAILLGLGSLSILVSY